MADAKRDWTQYDILSETEKRHSGSGFFNMLGGVAEEAFGEALDYGSGGPWQFPMGDLTVGQVLDFFAARALSPELRWHYRAGGPVAYVVVADYGIARTFRSEFGIQWLSRREAQDRADEDTIRASDSARLRH
jgi:hypothetical protein